MLVICATHVTGRVMSELQAQIYACPVLEMEIGFGRIKKINAASE